MLTKKFNINAIDIYLIFVLFLNMRKIVLVNKIKTLRMLENSSVLRKQQFR